MRCKCCNAEVKSPRKNKHTGELEDLCTKCLGVSLLTAFGNDHDITQTEDALDYTVLGIDVDQFKSEWD